MSQVLSFATARKTSRCNLVAGWMDGGSIEVYTADKPATPDTAISTQTLLVTFVFADPSGEVSNGVLTADDIATAQIAETGDAIWCRVKDSEGTTIGDGDVGLTNSGSFLEIDSCSLVEGGYISVSGFTFTEN